MAPWTRASELSRALRCPASCVLPRAQESRGPGAAQLGTDIHAVCSGDTPTSQVSTWLAGQPLPPPIEGLHDVLLGLDCDGGPVVMVSGAPRDVRDWVRASLTDGYVAGECDWVMWPEPWVKDLKTGWHVGGGTEQMLFYSLALQRQADTEDGYASIVHWPADGSQPPLESTEHLDRRDLEQWWEGEVIPASRLARGPNPPIVPGDHCHFCKCVTCPENWESNQGDYGTI